MYSWGRPFTFTAIFATHEPVNLIVQHLFWAPLTAFTVTLASVWWLARSRYSSLALDHPNERSLHEAPVPRTGGLGLHLGVLIAWAITDPHLRPQILIAFVLLLFVSFAEDLRGVPAALRLAAHVFAATLLSTTLLPHDEIVIIAVATLAIAWMTNLYNFMDGSDGLAAGMAAFGFSFYGVAALLADSAHFAVLNFSVATAAAAFLLFNFHPARIFLGDAGSVPLGFLVGGFGLIGWAEGFWTWWFPVLVYSPFLVDATVTLARRLLRRERVWQAHREHYYQRLVRMGWGHRKTALAEYALMAACGAVGLAALASPTSMQIVALAATAIVYCGLALCVDREWRRFRQGSAE